jgi:hypothetical protein
MIFHEFTDMHFPIFPLIARDFKGAGRISTFVWYFCGLLLTTATGFFCNVVKCFIAFLSVIDVLETEQVVARNKGDITGTQISKNDTNAVRTNSIPIITKIVRTNRTRIKWTSTGRTL